MVCHNMRQTGHTIEGSSRVGHRVRTFASVLWARFVIVGRMFGPCCTIVAGSGRSGGLSFT